MLDSGKDTKLLLSLESKKPRLSSVIIRHFSVTNTTIFYQF